MTAGKDAVGHLLSMAAQCIDEGCPDLAIDHYLLAYRQGVRDIVAEMDEYDCPEVPLGPRWADDATWVDWASLSLYHRAISEEYEGLKFFDDLVPRPGDLVLYGRYWVDKVDLRGRTVRVIMPDAYCHILVQLAAREVYRDLIPALINALLDFGRWSEAKRHAVDHAVLLQWRAALSIGGLTRRK